MVRWGVISLPETIWGFLCTLAAQPALAVTVGLVAAVILVNGATDAPNAIATAVGSGAIPFGWAAALAAVCNLAGAAGASMLSGAVAQTIYDIAYFGPQPGRALTALCAALVAIVVWALLAWRFGIPTSESHALVAGLSGAALAMPGGWANLHAGPWLRVGLGLFLSMGLGLMLGRRAAQLLRRFPLRDGFYQKAQIAGACAMALLHGAQDGQKFLGVLLLGIALAGGGWAALPAWIPVAVAICMALGTVIGGRRIVNRVGRDLVPLTLREGFAADLGGGCALLLCTVLGLPVSTTHTKTAAVLGAGCAGSARPNLDSARAILVTWLLTFPGCGAIGYVMATLLGRIWF